MKLKTLLACLTACISLQQPSYAYFDSPTEIALGAAAGVALVGAAGHFIKKYYFPTTKIATFVFDGPICNTRDVMNVLLHIKENDAIDGFLFVVQCPGGAPGQSELLYHLVADIAAKKPIVVQVIDCACSGGYLMIAPATAIVAPALGSVGCIGVLSSIIKAFPEKFENHDLSGTVEVHPFVSGKYKGIHNPNAPLSEDDKTEYQRQMDALYEGFLYLVARARTIDIANKDIWAEGKVFCGHEALGLKLVDYVGGFETALNVLKAELTKRGKRIDNLEFMQFAVVQA